MSQFFISCKESRVEHNRSFYGCFYLGPFDQGQSLTVANALRRTLLSELSGFAITSVEIEGVLHEYSTIPGVRDTVLDILLNLKEIVIKTSSYYYSSYETKDDRYKKKSFSNSLTDLEIKDYLEENVSIGYLQVRGPGVVRSGDLKLPPHFQCVDPDQYIATLSDGGLLNFQFEISKGKNYQIRSHEMIFNSFVPEETKNRQLWLKKMKTGLNQSMNFETSKNEFPRDSQQQSLNTRVASRAKQGNEVQGSINTSSQLFIDAVFMPVTKVNYIVELAEPYYENETMPSKKHTIILEIWTNGSIHPRKALYDSLKKLVNVFSKLYNVKFLGSMLRSNRTYEKMLHKFNFHLDSLEGVPTEVEHLEGSALLLKDEGRGSVAKPSLFSGFKSSQDKNQRKGSLENPRNATNEGTEKSQEKRTLQKVNIAGKTQSQSNRLLEDIGTLKLSLRAYSCLKKNNINTIGDLLQYTPQQLLTFQNLGQRSLEEVQKTLRQIGFSLLS